MACHSLEHCSSSLNISFKFYDHIFELVSKSHALTQVALSCQFELITTETIHNYFSTLDDFLQELTNKLGQLK